MKILRLILTIFFLGSIFTSCQKELSFEAGDAKGSLGKTTAGDCDPITVNGLYYVDTIMKATNYVDVQIDFTKIGIYEIKTDTINGYYFIASGSTGVLGLNTIRLFGKGKPIAASSNIFTVKFDGTQCTFVVPVSNIGTGGGGGTGNAVFNFAGAGCTGFTLAGTYISGVPMLPANKVTIPITVTTAGSYNITVVANGVTFSGSGMLTTASTSVILSASGTPPISTTAVATNYPISSLTSNCSFTVNYTATPAGGPAAFTFNCTAGTPSINGTFTVGVSTSGNSITVPIILTTAGTYNLSIAPVNGVSFVGTGFLLAGSTTVTLLASGTSSAAAAPSTNFPISFGTSSCSISVPFGSVPPASTNYYDCKIDGVLIDFNIGNSANASWFNPGLTDDLYIIGNNTTATHNYVIDIDKSSTGGNVTTGPYVNTLAGSVAGGYLMDVIYQDPSSNDWSPRNIFALPPATPDNFTVTITSLTATRVIGTFSGTIRSMAGAGVATKSVTMGRFNLPIQ